MWQFLLAWWGQILPKCWTLLQVDNITIYFITYNVCYRRLIFLIKKAMFNLYSILFIFLYSISKHSTLCLHTVSFFLKNLYPSRTSRANLVFVEWYGNNRSYIMMCQTVRGHFSTGICYSPNTYFAVWEDV